MKSSSQWVLRVVAAASLLALWACASKGATTLDEEANQPASARSGSPSDEDEAACGNGVIDEGEECDGADLDGVTCMNLGFESGRLFCDPVICTFETDGCRRPANQVMGGNGG